MDDVVGVVFALVECASSDISPFRPDKTNPFGSFSFSPNHSLARRPPIAKTSSPRHDARPPTPNARPQRPRRRQRTTPAARSPHACPLAPLSPPPVPSSPRAFICSRCSPLSSPRHPTQLTRRLNVFGRQQCTPPTCATSPRLCRLASYINTRNPASFQTCIHPSCPPIAAAFRLSNASSFCPSVPPAAAQESVPAC